MGFLIYSLLGVMQDMQYKNAQGLEGYLQGRELVCDDAKCPKIAFDASAEGRGGGWGFRVVRLMI